MHILMRRSVHLAQYRNALPRTTPLRCSGTHTLPSRNDTCDRLNRQFSKSRTHNYSTSSDNAGSATQALPKLIQPSFWRLIIPKNLRGAGSNSSPSPSARKPWNPATFYIVMSLLIGSQAIQSLALHKDFDTFSRQTETRLELLREVVRRLQAGEDVDVEKMLGTGVESEERAWEDMLKELEDEDELFRLRVRNKRAKRLAEQEASGNTSSEKS